MILNGRNVTAVLGPTNTGKTHYAIERMIAHETGVIGLPLRLLAREVYGRVAARVGADKVSLVTGEEKITPPGARFAVCTVEAMPRESDAAFVAIDEVQIAADLERGHVFTDRLLHLRGRQETLLLGAGTMRGILMALLPGLTVVERPRLSQLVHAGSKKITRLPRRSAIVAFSADEVYAIAELVRRQRGGAAVVMGALSPRTRNAQVALYQSGDVDYLVATDAIGMGLNLDVDHVAFAQTRKFDGYQFRPLTPSELGQIAGRAGRHVNDGSFGVTGRTDALDEALVQRIESHDFDPVKVLQWRTKQLDFASLDALRRSLDAVPPIAGLTRSLPAVDQQALDHLARFPEIADMASSPRRIETLWEVCALPDYRRITPAQHAEMIARIFDDLVRHGSVREDFLAEQVRQADRTDGEIDTLSARIAQIRTWTYVSHRPGWLADPTHWQEKTREIEDRLSDALHERLTKRFVDRRTSVLMKRLRENAMLEAEIRVDGDVHVEGHHVGQLSGFRFVPDQNAEGSEARAVLAAAQKALALEYEARAARLHASGNSDFAFGSDAVIRWLGEPVARLAADTSVMRPRAILLADDALAEPARGFVAARIERFVNHHISTVLKPLDDLSRAEDIEGLAKGVAFQLVENLGVVFRRDIADEVKALDQDARGSLRRYGVRFGAYHIFIPALLKPAPAELITLLWALKNDGFDKPGYGELIAMLAAGRTSIVSDPTYERAFYKLAGFRYLGKRAVRIDILERLSDLIRPALHWTPGSGPRPNGGYDGRRFMSTSAMLSILGATPDDMEEILKGLGYRADVVSPEEAAEHLARLDGAAATETATPDNAAQGPAEVAAPVKAESAASVEAPEGASVPAAATQAPAEKVSEVVEPTGDAARPEPAAEAATAEAAVSPGPDTPAVADDGTDAAKDAGAAASGEGEGKKPEPQAGESAVAEHKADEEQNAGEEPKAEEEPKPVLLWRPLGRGEGRNRHQARGRGGDNEAGRNGKAAFKGKRGKPGKPGGKPKHGGDGGPRPHERRPHKDKPVDPDSPFAKLAALKEQMKK